MFKSDSTLKAVSDYCEMNAENPPVKPCKTELRSDLCLSLYSVGVQSILIEQLTVVLQVSPKLNRILPQLKQKPTSVTPRAERVYLIKFTKVYISICKLLLLHITIEIT